MPNIGPAGAEIKTLTSTARRYLAVGVAMCLSIAVFFRHALLGGLATIYGDSYDGLIEVAILQHWHNVFAHGAAWNVTDYFFPHPGTLGYNDTFIVPGVFFAVARMAGADPFVAAFLSHVAMRAIGFAGMYALLRRGVNIRVPLSLAGAAIFTTAGVSLVHMYHAQTLSVGLTPWLALGLLSILRALLRNDTRSLRLHGVAFAFLLGLAALNAFYGVWFFCLFAGVAAVVGFLLAGPQRRAELVAAVRRQWVSLGMIVFAALIAFIPFIATYAPKLAEGAHHSWRAGAHRFLPDVVTLFNVGPGNLVWGPAFRALLPTGASLPGGEDQVGLPVGLLVILVLAVSWAAKDRRGRAIPLILGLAFVILLGAMMRWPGDVSLWYYVYQWMPGADAVRVVSRFLLFALVPVIVIAMSYLQNARRPLWLTAVLVGFLLVEQVQTRPPLSLDRAKQLRMLADVGRPPSPCGSFFVVAARSDDHAALAEGRRIATSWGSDGSDAERLYSLYRHNVDAMLIAGYHHVPTINGFSSFNPPDWAFADPRGRDYLVRVERYVREHRLENVCGLDVQRQPHWFRFNPRAAPPNS